MVVTAPANSHSGNGPRPINLNRDIPHVLELLELAFGERLGRDGYRLFSGGTNVKYQPAFLWRLNPATNKLALGYVWEEHGRIVGNATLLPTRNQKRYLVVNVAVHPEYRRRGIARGLMESIIDLVRSRRGNQILLQVVHDNTAAINLYHSLRFQTIGSMTTWHNTVSRLRNIEPTLASSAPPAIRELHRREWRHAYLLDVASLDPDLNWPEPLPKDAYRQDLWRRFINLINGRQMEVWATTTHGDQLTGLAGIWSEWGRSHQMTLRIHPRWQGVLERPLLAKTIRRLRYLPRRNIRLEHPAADKPVNDLLREANFQPRRTLTHMRFDLAT